MRGSRAPFPASENGQLTNLGVKNAAIFLPFPRSRALVRLAGFLTSGRADVKREKEGDISAPTLQLPSTSYHTAGFGESAARGLFLG
jgi:hypothetical protein